MRVEQYQDWAVQAVLGILEHEHAVIWSEVEARASERPWGEIPYSIDPHHLTTARRRLTEWGELVTDAQPTRGGRIVEVQHLASAPKRAVETAAARKRLLQARFLGWAKGTRRHPRGLIGGAGEKVTAASLGAAAPSGYQLLASKSHDVGSLFGREVAGGPLDNAAHLITTEDDVPTGITTVLIEVKNVREWLYPTAKENYQLLYKAARLQREHPDRAFVPVLVCRRGHKTLFKMAKSFGFYVIDSRRQFITPSADVAEEALIEIRRELSYSDLVATDEPDALITKHFRLTLPAHATAFAARWAIAGPALEEMFKALRIPMDPRERGAMMDHLRERARLELDDSGGW